MKGERAVWWFQKRGYEDCEMYECDAEDEVMATVYASDGKSYLPKVWAVAQQFWNDASKWSLEKDRLSCLEIESGDPIDWHKLHEPRRRRIQAFLQALDRITGKGIFGQ